VVLRHEKISFLGETGLEIVSPFFAAPSPTDVSPVGNAAAVHTSAQAHFRLDELEVIFENLCDMLSDPSFIPSLFISFDCNPTSGDVVQPLVQYVCRCNW
jgi:hypothetical protein